MHDARLVGVLQAVAELHHQIHLHVDARCGGGAEIVGQRDAVEQLHHDERPPLVFSQIEQRDDVAMGELSGDPRFAIETLSQFGLLFEVREHQLDRHTAPEVLVHRAIDDPHGALADPVDNAITADVLRRYRLGSRLGHRSAS